MESTPRNTFNLKVLQRHDSSISEIIDSASFVVLYNYNSEWAKTGVEGPLFLFRRNTAPFYGFFILNRNGIENFTASITPEDDLEITPEFIIYRPENSDETEVYGIWIFEPSQRENIGERIISLQKTNKIPSVPSTDVSASESASESGSGSGSGSGAISLDDLFGTLPKPTPTSTRVSRNASDPNPDADLDSDSAQNLLALLGVGSTRMETPIVNGNGRTTPTPSKTQTQTLTLGPTSAPASASASASEPLDMSQLIHQRIGTRIPLDENGQPLSRREFITHLLSLIHTDTAFVDELYKNYTTRVSL